MTDFNLDRIKFRWKGNWVADTVYIKDDVVYYDGKAYVCLQGHSSTTFLDDNYTSLSKTFTVTVAADTLNERSQGKFYINGVESPTINLIKGKTYIFNLDSASNNNDPLLLSNVFDGDLIGGNRYSQGVSYFINDTQVNQETYISNFATATSRELRFIPPTTAPIRIFYYSAANLHMGNFLKTKYESTWEVMFDGTAWKDNWASQQIYIEGSIVKFNGYLYKCVISHQSTSSLTDDISKWSIFAITSKWKNIWTVNTSYVLGDIVLYGGNTYICSVSHTSAATAAAGLELNQSNWNIVTISDFWKKDWTVATRYIVNDVIRYGGIVYKCIQNHTSAATEILGLEDDQTKWKIVNSGIEYKGIWTGNARYKLNDIVRYGASLWQANQGHVSTTADSELREDEIYWNIWIPGLNYESLHDLLVEYSQGDIVVYGGYAYVALRNNQETIPGSSLEDWQIITTGYKPQGDWESSKSYKTGDIVKSGGSLYLALANNQEVIPAEQVAIWEKLVDGNKYRAEWNVESQYFTGDLVIYRGILYNCIAQHFSSEANSNPNTDLSKTIPEYWQVLILSTQNNVLSTIGDLKTFDQLETRLPIGSIGNAIKVIDNGPLFGNYEEVDNIFYVSNNGIDLPTSGKTVSAPFKTVKYACEYVLNNVNTSLNTSIFIKTGFYQEQLPIVVPVNTALIGDELRSTTITPAAGFEASDMFYVRNGSGIRNMTLQGLTGTLGEPNQYLTRRPSAGAFVSLDPGTGPADTSVWITNKSCYVQNVSTFGTACVGMKIDGSLHNGGNRSIVANDFTQILSDGIGYWARSGGRSELVSVFTYFCHIGYLTEDGGILRATNGNNSYGTYGSVAEGFDENEIPVTGNINNRAQEAQFSESITFGTDQQQILAIGYSHAGQNYTSADIEFSGSGTGAVGQFREFRNNAISNVRILDSDEVTPPGGLNYLFVINSAQSGNNQQIILSQADFRESQNYIGQRIVIVSGLGVGQYAEITAYDSDTKIAIVSRESDGGSGWDHFQPGWPIELLLDATTRYAIEPRVTVEEPLFSNSAVSGFDRNYEFASFGNNKYIALTGGVANYNQQFATFSLNGETWAAETNLGENFDISGLTFTGNRFFAIRRSNNNEPHNTVLFSTDGEFWSATTLPISSIFVDISSDGRGNVAILTSTQEILYSSNHGLTWTVSSIGGTTQNFGKIQYGNNKLIALEISGGGDVAVSINNGANWSITSNAIISNNWNDIIYGNGRFVAINLANNIVAYSFNGNTWYNSVIESPDSYNRLSYGDGVFIATGTGGTIARSQDGLVWRVFNKDSTVYSLSETGSWTASAYSSGKWVILRNDSSTWNTINTGAVPIVRAKVANSSISELTIYDPGSNLSQDVVLEIFDNNNTADADYTVFVNSGVLSQPEMNNRGTGYFTATAIITGNGFAELFQIGKFINVNNLTAIPGPGDNLTIEGIDEVLYSVVKLISISNSNPFTARLQITPNIKISESPLHNENISLRKKFSQIRLTGHDFLDIGTGNTESTRYPALYTEGEDAINARQPFNETLGFGGGRVFFTSTDQDGNFKVGSLFKVEQSTGVVTVDASQFDLSGLTELALGGIQVGVSPVVVREFSIDPNFTANSNNVVPTQKAIASFIVSRISGGGSDVSTNTLVSGQVSITGNNINTTSGLDINIPVVLNVKKGFDGKYLALQYFARNNAK